MLLFLLLLDVFLEAKASEECFENLNTFQCSCIDQKGYTPFWTDHNKIDSDNWTASISVTDNKCSEQDALEFIKHKDSTSSDSGGTSKPGSMDEIIVNMISKGYIQHGESLYKLNDKITYWDDARRICLSEGSHLVIPNSEDEVKFLGNLLKMNLIRNQVFIGINDIVNEGEHVTIFGEPASIAYDRFYEATDIDNFIFVGLAGEDCNTVYPSGRLNDYTCTFSHEFICELELNEYPPKRAIDYNNGPYSGVESAKGASKGKVKRTVASLGYEFYPGFGFYRFHTTPQAWESARLICEEEDAHLAIINSIFEHSLLMKYFEIILPKPPKEIDDETRAHIGFHDLFQEGRHVTLFNETLQEAGFSEWFHPKQPDNAKNHIESSGQNCGALHKRGGIDDVDCNDLLAFICEQELYE